MVRVLFVQAGFGPGGAEKVISMLSGHFARRGLKVHVTAFSMPEQGPYFENHPDVEISALTGKSGQLRRLMHIRKTVRQFKPDLVISFLTKVNVLTLLATLDKRIPVIICERNNPKRQNAHPLWLKLKAVLGMRAAKVVALTQKGLADLPPTLRKRGIVIPNPITPFDVVAPTKTGPASQLVSIGRLVPQKGFDMLLQAMQRIHAHSPETTLTIYGEGPERGALETLRRDLGLEGVVNLPGNTPEVGLWAKNSEIVLATSRFEGFHNVVAEAAVSGIPIVSFDCDYGPSDLIDHGRNGFLVPTGDVDALAASALQLIQDPHMRTEMAANHTDIRHRLAPDLVFSVWDDLIAEVTS